MKKPLEKTKILLFFLAAGFFVFAFRAEAATFNFTPALIPVGGQATVDLLLDTEGEEINAVQATLNFSPAEFEINSVSDSNSLVSLWLDEPVFDNAKGTIYFSGLIPGGWAGSSGELLRLTLTPKGRGTSFFTLTAVQALKNDGQGTPAPFHGDIKLIVSKYAPEQTSSTPDRDPPEAFAPIIGRDQNVFQGRYFLTFSTTDKGSGMDHYEILEVIPKNGTPSAEPWKTAGSPYELTDQSLGSDVYVRAVDKAGNFTVAKVSGRPLAKATSWGITGYAIFVGILVFLIIVSRWYARREKA